MRSRNVIIIGSDVPNNCFKVSFTLRISEKKKKENTTTSNIRIKYRSSRMHFKNMSSEWTKAHMHCGWLFGFRHDGEEGGVAEGRRRSEKGLRVEWKNSLDIISNFFETRGRYARLARSLTHVRRRVTVKHLAPAGAEYVT